MPARAGNFIAAGTEPFWSVRMVRGGLVWSSPDNEKGTQFAADCRPLAGGGTQCVGAYQNAPLRMVISPGECSDGMSDIRYRWNAKVVHGSYTFTGCARPN